MRIYATNDILVIPRSDLESNNVEAVWIEVQGKESMVVGCLYLPPHETLQFGDDIDELLSQPAIGRHKIILAGDLNVDITHGVPSSANRESLDDICAGHNFKYLSN